VKLSQTAKTSSSPLLDPANRDFKLTQSGILVNSYAITVNGKKLENLTGYDIVDDNRQVVAKIKRNFVVSGYSA
jgi:hypothetical protein